MGEPDGSPTSPLLPGCGAAIRGWPGQAEPAFGRDRRRFPRRGKGTDTDLGTGLAGDAVLLGRLGHGRRDERRDVAVEDARDDVLGAELVRRDHRRERT